MTISTKPETANFAAALSLSRAVPIVMAFVLGAFIVGGVGFSHLAAVHNAAHDYRHSMGFPCH
ncbi:MAG: CbtB-domain containing protein [Hyphomicrobiales bacterium]